MKRFGFVFFAALLFACAAYGQGGPPGPHGFERPGGFGPGLHSGKIVTGAPYSATATSQFTQTLVGGNTIQRTRTALVARDSLGRTYEQETISGGPLAQNGPTTITFISDPVAGYRYVLNPNTKVATRHAIRTPSFGGNSNRTALSNRPADANRVETDLSTQVINGITAQGKSITHTIPAGVIGNASPIVSTTETWYSPDLQVPVLVKWNDPRAGQSTYTLTNIVRAEPSATLFKVPSDYTIQDAPASRQFPGQPQ